MICHKKRYKFIERRTKPLAAQLMNTLSIWASRFAGLRPARVGLSATSPASPFHGFAGGSAAIPLATAHQRTEVRWRASGFARYWAK